MDLLAQSFALVLSQEMRVPICGEEDVWEDAPPHCTSKSAAYSASAAKGERSARFEGEMQGWHCGCRHGANVSRRWDSNHRPWMTSESIYHI